MRSLMIIVAFLSILIGCSTRLSPESESTNSTKKPSSAVIINDIISRENRVP